MAIWPEGVKEDAQGHIKATRIRAKDRQKLVGAWLLAICGYLQMASLNIPRTIDDWFRLLIGLGMTIGGLLMNRGVPTRKTVGEMRPAERREQ